MNKLFFIFCFFMISQFSNSQKWERLSLGDEFPDITLTNFLDEPDRKISKDDLKAKLVIFDFWDTKCGSCIKAMPLMDSLQNEFGSKIQIIGVARESGAEIKQLFAKLKINRPSFPLLTGDTALNEIFKHLANPLHVWIDANGKVAAITSHYNTNRFSISNALAGQTINLPRRLENELDLDYPLLSEQNRESLSLTESYSILQKQTQELTTESPVFVKRDTSTGRIYFIEAVNQTILNLYRIAYEPKLYGFNVNTVAIRRNNRILLELQNSTPFITPEMTTSQYAGWIRKNNYSYELLTPTGKDGLLCMQEDLDRYFGYQTSIRKVKRNCLVLIRTSGIDKIKSNKLNVKGSFQERNGVFLVRNMPLNESVLRWLVYGNYLRPEPIVDRTGYLGNIDIELHAYSRDLDNLRKELQKYDLDLVQKEAEIDMLVIKDKLP